VKGIFLGTPAIEFLTLAAGWTHFTIFPSDPYFVLIFPVEHRPLVQFPQDRPHTNALAILPHRRPAPPRPSLLRA